ncbi:MAG: hypothetical protein EXS31_02750 [Pedosphaera sp.]|nr:hypothetical protein [Pedosphaera sp.]
MLSLREESRLRTLPLPVDATSLTLAPMITIDTVANITGDQMVKIPLPSPISPGPHRVVMVIDEAAAGPPAVSSLNGPLGLSLLQMAGWPPNSTFRREEIYGDDGR